MDQYVIRRAWTRYGNWPTTRSCIAATRAPTRRSACTGSPTVSRSAVPANINLYRVPVGDADDLPVLDLDTVEVVEPRRPRPRILPSRAADAKIGRMSSPSFSELLKLPPAARAELAMDLWDSLSADDREEELALTPAEAAELDRRWQQHLEGRSTAIPWERVRRKLLDRE